MLQYTSNLMTAKLKVLCLHGFTQNADKFKDKASQLTKKLNMDFTWLSGPIKLPVENDDARAWWTYSDINTLEFDWNTIIDKNIEHVGFANTIRYIQDVFIKQGPFDGIMGFSQGATLAGYLCANREELKLDFKFAIMMCGFKSYLIDKVNINIPSIHIIGKNDTIILPSKSRELANAFKDPILIEHNGRHVILSNGLVKNKILELVANLKIN